MLRKVAERVLRDITIIIFRRFSTSTSLHELREQHLYNHKVTGHQVKRQREMSLSTTTSLSTKDSSPSPSQEEQMPNSPSSSSENEDQSGINEQPLGWDAAALRIITFLSSRINPNVCKDRDMIEI